MSSEPKTELAANYDFDQDAMGLADFITEQMDASGDDVSPVVYVVDQDGRQATRADWFIETLSDGSKVAELRLRFL